MTKTVKVRICVAVSADGLWYATGWQGKATQWHDGQGYHAHFVEAEVPLPEEATVEGKVVG